jgi:hypothetical protein
MDLLRERARSLAHRSAAVCDRRAAFVGTKRADARVDEEAEPPAPGAKTKVMRQPKKQSLGPKDVVRLTDPHDRTICAILTGAAEPGQAWVTPYGRDTQSSSVWQVADMLAMLAPMIDATGRFRWMVNDRLPIMPLQLQADHVWDLTLSIVSAPDGARKLKA